MAKRNDGIYNINQLTYMQLPDAFQIFMNWLLGCHYILIKFWNQIVDDKILVPHIFKNGLSLSLLSLVIIRGSSVIGLD